MVIKDFLVIGFFLCIILFAVFHQLASRIILKSPDLMMALYGFDVYKNKSVDISNMQAIMSVITVINLQYRFFAKNNPNYIFFKRRRHPLFPNLDTKNAIYIVKKYKKLNYYVNLQGVFGVLFLAFGVAFIYIE